MRPILARTAWPALALTLWLAAPASGQEKPALTPADYGRWEELGAGSLSPDGKWLAYTITRVGGDGELRVRSLAVDSTRVVAYGSRPAFSADGRWLAYSVGVSEKERERLEKAKQPVQSKVGVLDLATGKELLLPAVSSFAFSEAGPYLVLRGYPLKEKKSKGSDLVVRDLVAGTATNFGNVADFSWQKKGALLAMTVDAEGTAGNGVLLYDPTSGVLRTLASDTMVFKGPVWRKDADDLAVLEVRSDSLHEGETHRILAWQGLAGKRTVARTFDPASASGFPADTRIVDVRTLAWSTDGRSLFFGIKEWERKAPRPLAAASAAKAATDSTSAKGASAAEASEPAGVEVWHAADIDIIPEQKVRASSNRNRNDLAVWHLEAGRFVKLGRGADDDVMLVEGVNVAIGADQAPYGKDRMFGPLYRDFSRVDLQTGERTPLAPRVQFSFGSSPGGRYFLYLENDHYWTVDLRSGTRTNITARVATSFINQEDDHTVTQKPPFGMAGWTVGDRSVVLYDKYDLWEVRPDGSGATRLTNGTAEQVRHRYVRLDPEERSIDLSRPLYLSLYGEWTKKFGYARLRAGRAEKLVWLDRNVGRLARAKDAERYAYVVQGFDQSPNFYVGGPTLADAQKVTDTNPFQKDFAWGKSELVDFENARGEKLQGALFYPANYQPGKKYPMLVYIYEILSNTLHNYSVPSERRPYNPAVFTSQGYFVFQPDITYRDRNPGLSAVESIVPAVEKVLERGMVDPARVGLVGHSWGAYQTAFTVTQTKLFSAAVAGAPLTDLVSMYLSIYWNTGGTDARIFEISQGRMEVPFWEDLEAYMANSPLFNVQKMDTPLLVAFGDKDGAVDWHQGIELYNAARRAGKEMVMLVYEGENHSLAKKPNQLDYHRRINEWFAHYLKGESAPRWMTSGVSVLEREKELEQARKDRAGSTSSN